ncbi:DUF2946 domain-containing protein [Pseudocitrobacter cyperus]|uniref:DUF2946 domain-containing protein n=1 Tax=Pseudocitrobacter cyperus TaxID=3112843 RepID=A0ABV0HKU5_9ENTR
MNSNRFHASTLKRRALWLALFAIALIIVAPLISISLQKDPMSAMPGMHHAMNMDTEGHSSHQSMPVDHAEACGYCVLLAHVPGLILALAILLCGLLLRCRTTPVRPAIKQWHFFPWLFPDTRAPPRLSAFSC